MDIVEISWVEGLAGGCLIGLAAVMLMAADGRIAGISGIFAGILRPTSAAPWQWAFVAGLLASGLAVDRLLAPIPLAVVADMPALAAAGLLVGFGTRLGSGCTSGHGVCGVARLSPRSLVATAVFVASGMATVLLLRLAV